ncbi:MAG: ParB N-terminal domain-containing protein [Saprospiraceae bacterium]
MTSNITRVKIDDLLFDFLNPRLSEFGIDASTPQEEILAKLWDSMGAEEIYLSIAASGFFQHEPLIVIEASEAGKYIVIEGNRRLAAVKAILTPGFVEDHGSSDLPAIPQDIKVQLKELPCIEATRQDAWRFIGFKHVNGAAKWGSYAKAKFIAQIRNEYGLPIPEIAKQIGDTTKIATKLYQALMVIEQAEKSKVFSLEDVPAKRLYFSHLYNGLNHENIKSFIGLNEFREGATELVPNEKLKELGELLTWMFGSKKNEAKPLIVSQNPDLKHLGMALGSKESIAALRSNQTLEVAYEISLPDPLKFEQSLNDAKRSLYDVQKYLVTGFDGKSRDMVETAKTIADLAESIFNGMKEKHTATLPVQPKKRTID